MHFYFGPKLFYVGSLMLITDKAARNPEIPVINIIAGIELPTIGKMIKLSNEATICGKQIEQLNKPR